MVELYHRVGEGCQVASKTKGTVQKFRVTVNKKDQWSLGDLHRLETLIRRVGLQLCKELDTKQQKLHTLYNWVGVVHPETKILKRFLLNLTAHIAVVSKETKQC